MRIPPDLRDTVVFLDYRTNDDLNHFVGTAFFYRHVVYRPDGNTDGYQYLVTAKHNVRHCKFNGFDQKIYVRINQTLGIARFIPTEFNDWVADEENSEVDIAVLAVSDKYFTTQDLILDLDSRIAVNAQMTSFEGFGPGDDTFIVGLFGRHKGEEKNRPIVRVGNIAAMPEEKVAAEYADIDAYLIEIRSIGSLSGSPVFVYMTHPSWFEQIAQEPNSGPKIVLLGVVHGHWPTLITQPGPDGQQIKHEIVNEGIAIVTPADKIANVMAHPHLVAHRAAIDKQNADTVQGNSPT